MGEIKCPKCGYEPAPDDSLRVWDRNDVVASVGFDKDGVLGDPTWEITEIWENKDRITCPSCDAESPMRDWGLRWNWTAWSPEEKKALSEKVLEKVREV